MEQATSAPTKDCEWFTLCDREATHTQFHPILGEVPICDRCQAKYDNLCGDHTEKNPETT